MAALNSITGEDYFFDACRVKTLSIHLSGILRVANVLYVNIDNYQYVIEIYALN